MDEKVKEETVRQETAVAAGKAPEEDKAGCLGEIGQGEVTTEAGGQAGGESDSKDRVAGKREGR